VIYLYVLLAIPVADSFVAVPATLTIGYYATIGECHKDRNRIEPTVNKTFIKLDCKPIKAVDEE
jgi:hypothetical protein